MAPALLDYSSEADSPEWKLGIPGGTGAPSWLMGGQPDGAPPPTLGTGPFTASASSPGLSEESFSHTPAVSYTHTYIQTHVQRWLSTEIVAPLNLNFLFSEMEIIIGPFLGVLQEDTEVIHVKLWVQWLAGKVSYYHH